jgi:FtsP/CotA-like multicopper oxidase with cupredoxin domain/fibronectin type 3 domain-containing protein
MTVRRRWLVVGFALLLLAALMVAAGASAAAQAKAKRVAMTPRQQAIAMMNTAHHKVHGVMHHGRVTPSQRVAAAARLQAKLAKAGIKGLPIFHAARGVGLATMPDYYTNPNWNISPSFVKFTQALPSLTVASPDTSTFPGSDYYIIAVVNYTQKMGDLAGYTSTQLRGYVQLNAAGGQVAPPSYLGPAIIATRGTPVRIKFVDMLPAGDGGNLFLPVDTTTMGAGLGPDGAAAGNYPQNRAVIHLHGGDTAWISDGTPHQWITPAGNTSVYKRGVSQRNVPDMMFDPTTHVALGPKGSAAANAVPGATDDPGPGAATYFYTNNESARLMFYHDHTYGMTRLNVYAGEAAAYTLTDTAEATLTAAGGLPADQIPLVIQDKSFVDASTIGTLDPTWSQLPSLGTPVGQTTGSLWFPHVYMPNQNPSDVSGANAFGRWDYGPWFWPIFNTAAGLQNGPVLNPLYPAVGQGQYNPGTPNPSMVPEHFADTMLVNGMAYPFKTVDAKPYRLRILNASNDRMLNLSLFISGAGNSIPGTPGVFGITAATVSAVTMTTPDPITGASSVATITVGSGGSYYSAPGVDITPTNGVGGGAMAEAILTPGAPPQPIQSIVVTSGGSGFTAIPKVTIGADSEVRMVEACPDGANFPASWPTDGRAGGVPDPLTAGPSWVQVGTEGGFMPKAADIPAQPVNYNYNRRDIVVLNVADKSLFLGPAERADVVVDFTKYAGKTVILYNDAPAPVPAFDPRNDNYTGGPDMRDMGGSKSILVGQGPNTRTVMVFKVAAAVSTPYTRAALDAGLPIAYQASQPKPIVPQESYPGAWTATAAATAASYSRIQDNALTFTPVGAPGPQTIQLQPKAIQELFEMQYGRMNATLGVELPFTNSGNQTTIPLGYVDPITETILGSDAASYVGSANDGTQIWKITHNGVDTHAIHFHLYNVQLINRVGWDGAIRPPDANELGWKETIRMNPLEDCIVALRPIEPVLPFKIGDSVRPLDPTAPVDSIIQVTNPANGNPISVPNAMTNFGWEYMWHCHLLGHEENDMMRPVSLAFSPNAPTSLFASALTSPLRVNLSWTGNAAANPPTTNYLIQRATNAGFTADVTTFSVTAPATTYSDTSVASGTTYYYRVRAENVSAYSGWSNVQSVLTPGALLPAPSGLAASVTPSPLSVGLTWVNGAGAPPYTGLTIQRATDAGFNLNVVTFTAASATSTAFADGTVANGTTYFYRVRAVGAAPLQSAWSNVVSVYASGTVLAPPSALAAVVTPSPLSVGLSWVNGALAPPYTGITIQRATDAAFTLNVTTFTAASASAFAYTDSTVVAGTIYYYRVQAVAGPIVSAWSNMATASTPLPAPSALAATPIANPLSVGLTWVNNAAAPPVTSLTIQRATDGAFTLNVATFTPASASATSYTDSSVAAGTTYYYRIRAVAGAVVSAWSGAATVVTSGTPPAAPTNLRLVSNSTFSLSVAWNNNGGATSNVVQYSASGSSGPWTTSATLAGTATSYKINGLANARNYWVRVLATNASGQTSSNVLLARTQ